MSGPDAAATRSARIVSIVGTRPEAIKMEPVARAFAARPQLRHRVVLTGQHAGLAPLFDAPGIESLDLACDPRNLTAPKLRETLHAQLCGHFQREPADLVLVQGDTASAVAGAMAARDCGIAVGHVEAGLRSGDLHHPWPEEGNRIVVDALSALLFAPTEAAADNLRRDWRVTGEIHVTGNTGIDALLQVREALPQVFERTAPSILVTCHRRENQGDAFEGIAQALRRIPAELGAEIVFLLHPNRHLRSSAERLLGGCPGIRLVEPPDHAGTVALMAAATFLLTDSGGLQEEGPALGKAVLVMRDTTERPEAVAAGNAALVGGDPERIFTAAAVLLREPETLARMSRPAFPFGDGRAAPRIVAAVEAWLGRGGYRAA